MALVDLYIRVVKALEETNAAYMIIGAFAGSIFGITRSTADVDLMVDLREEHFEPLSEKFPLPRYYADPEMMRNSTKMGIMFNIIDTNEGTKADLVPLGREPEYRLAFGRRVRGTFTDENGTTFEAWVAQPTDIIIGKLRAWDEGRSNKHPGDIYVMVAFDLNGYGEIKIDYDHISKEATSIGNETFEMWKQLVERAKEEIRKGPTPRKW